MGIDRVPSEMSIDAVLVDNVAGARQAVGHKRIGIVTGLSGITSMEKRLTGYQQALEVNGIPRDPILIVRLQPRLIIRESSGATFC